MNEEKTPSEELLEDINEWYPTLREMDLEERKSYAEYKTEEYFNEHGEFPHTSVLTRLADLIMYDHLEGDTRQNKHLLEEYPIQTQAQYDRKVKGKTQSRRVAYVEAPLPDSSILESGASRPLDLDFLDDLNREID